MELSKSEYVNIWEVEKNIKTEVEKLVVLLKNHRISQPEKYSVSECKIETEEYIEENIESHMINREKWSREVEEMGINTRKERLVASETKNQLVAKAKDNIREIRAISLAAILKTRNLKLVCKDQLDSCILEKNLSSGHHNGTRVQEMNIINPATIPSFRFGSQNNIFVRISVHSSINYKKINEIFARVDCNLSEIADEISCQIRAMQLKIYNRFFFLENFFAHENDSNGIEVGEKEILAKIEKEKLDIEVRSLSNTFLNSLKIQFNKRYIYRDCVGCDHVLIFNDVIYCDLGKLRIVNTFSPHLKREECQSCGTSAEYLISNCCLSSESINFLCTRCFNDIFLTPEGKLKITNAEIYPYRGVE